MKKLLTILFLTFGIFLISGCSLTEQKPANNSTMTEKITALQQQMSGLSSQIEILKQENEQLKVENQNLKINFQQESDKTETTEKNELSENKKFNSSDIEFIIDEDNMTSYYIYKAVKKYGKWYIWVRIWWQDWVWSDLLYIENWKKIKELKNIFWYDNYTNYDIHEYCNNSLDKCPIAKKISCKMDNEKNKECINSFFEYMFNLINGIEKNDYFTEKFNWFVKWL